METEEKKWCEPDETGMIDIPDYLEPLFNKIGFQFRFHTISGVSEPQAVARATFAAEKFFKNKNKESLIEFLKWYRTQIIWIGCNEEAVIDAYIKKII